MMDAPQNSLDLNRPTPVQNLAARPPVVLLTDAAAARVKSLLAAPAASDDGPAYGVRIGIRNRGCSGMSYTVDYAQEKGAFDEVIEQKGVRVLIDPRAMMFLLGTEMDYIEEPLKSGFIFRNPNEKGRCGCGESFHV
ncbi:MAG: iron-sulfur cluster assembly accessory protein [Candidatus Symbiobacter sp.]|nr:iron-sulfur cluster assembly accessory protein [Candidatus Symbiobacter sp.]